MERRTFEVGTNVKKWQTREREDEKNVLPFLHNKRHDSDVRD